MGFDTLIQSGVAMANRLTKKLQPNVTLRRRNAAPDAFGAVEEPTVLVVSALVERKQVMIRTRTGQEVQSQHKITFLEVIPDLGIAGRREPIDESDELVLPDGTTGPILRIEALLNPTTGRGFLYEVWLG